jgi:hypothetical protein
MTLRPNLRPRARCTWFVCTSLVAIDSAGSDANLLQKSTSAGPASLGGSAPSPTTEG